jgi:hypothetical protein
MVACCIDARKGANHANRRKARHRVTVWQVACDAAMWEASGSILHSTAKGSDPQPTHRFPTMTFLKISAVFLLPLLALFVGSLASEDQRHFLACRQTGASADACLLQISGR